MTAWSRRPMVLFDLETTGVDVFTDRIVTADVAWVNVRDTGGRRWLINPGVPIPAEAAEIHGITTKHAVALGGPPAEALAAIVDTLVHRLTPGEGAPPPGLVVMNAPYDLTMLDAECRRHDVATVPERTGRPWGPVIDPMVIDRHLDQYRPRPDRFKLTDICRVYGAVHGGAHDSTEDAYAAGRAVWRIAQRAQMAREQPRRMWALYRQRYPAKADNWKVGNIIDRFRAFADLGIHELHAAQRTWYEAQSTDLVDYFRKVARAKRREAEELRVSLANAGPLDDAAEAAALDALGAAFDVETLATEDAETITQQIKELLDDADQLDAKAKEVRTSWPVQTATEPAK